MPLGYSGRYSFCNEKLMSTASPEFLCSEKTHIIISLTIELSNFYEIYMK